MKMTVTKCDKEKCDSFENLRREVYEPGRPGIPNVEMCEECKVTYNDEDKHE